MRTRSSYAAAALLAALAGAAAAVFLTRENAEPPPQIGGYVLPEPRPLGSFELVDERGERFAPADFAGHWSFLYFGYTYCPDVCPLALVELANVKKLLAASAPGVAAEYYLVSVDPARDTAERLGEYVAYFDPSFHGVTGSLEALTTFANQAGAIFFVPEDQDHESYLVSHSSSIVLLDPDGRVYAIFSPPHAPEQVAADFAKVAAYHARTAGR
jgi:protein SCO1/2